MGLSAQLKGEDYRELLEITDLTYGVSCPDALFAPVRYDTRGVAGFGSRISPTYPVARACANGAYPSVAPTPWSAVRGRMGLFQHQ